MLAARIATVCIGIALCARAAGFSGSGCSGCSMVSLLDRSVARVLVSRLASFASDGFVARLAGFLALCAQNYFGYPTCTYCVASTTCTNHGATGLMRLSV